MNDATRSGTRNPLSTDVYAVILAGGSGTRFWPRSRLKRPKQLCRIGGDPKTMLEITLDRLDGLVPPERRLIVTHREQVPGTQAVAGDACRTILAEPEARNTAAALTLAALQIERMAPTGTQPVMISLHADHVIRDEAAFREALATAVAVAREGWLTLLGIKPAWPETGYGYLEQGEPMPGHRMAFKVASFREKPPVEEAKAYVQSGRFHWNAGLFVWRVDVLLSELRRTQPPLVDKLSALCAGRPEGFLGLPADRMAAVYAELPRISIDHAVLEVSKRVAGVACDIGWLDVGSWDALGRAFQGDAKGNLAFGDTCLIDSKGTTVDTDGPFVAVVGGEDLVVVASQGAVLVCPRSRSQDVKKVVEWLDAKGRRELL